MKLTNMHNTVLPAIVIASRTRRFRIEELIEVGGSSPASLHSSPPRSMARSEKLSHEPDA